MFKLATIVVLLFISTELTFGVPLAQSFSALRSEYRVLSGGCDGHRSKRSPCNPLQEESNRFKGRTFEDIREEFRDAGFIEHSPNSFQCPITGAKYYLDKGGVYRKGQEFEHIDLTHDDWPGYKLKFPLGDKLSPTQRGVQLYKTTIKNEQVHVTSIEEMKEAGGQLYLAILKSILKFFKNNPVQ